MVELKIKKLMECISIKQKLHHIYDGNNFNSNNHFCCQRTNENEGGDSWFFKIF